MLMKRKVTRPVKEIAGTLASITGGELDEKVSVRSSSEFETISEGINKTVDSIKEHIAREAARIDEELRNAWEIQYSALPLLTDGLKNNRYFGLFSSMNTAKEVFIIQHIIEKSILFHLLTKRTSPQFTLWGTLSYFDVYFAVTVAISLP